MHYQPIVKISEQVIFLSPNLVVVEVDSCELICLEGIEVFDQLVSSAGGLGESYREVAAVQHR